VSGVRTGARLLLAGIRLFMGLSALAIPETLGRSVGVDPQDRAAVYFIRLFGVRTVVLGVELLVTTGRRREEALRTGVAIHVADAGSAAVAGLTGRLAPRAALTTTGISTVNACLAKIAQGA
jgi:hypothetical protein